MRLRERLFPINQWLEPLLALGAVTGAAWAVIYLVRLGYLPQPFFYEPQDTWMDWFNTAHWAHQPGAYDVWGTIYPPLSFVLLKFLTNPICYEGAEGLASRDCDWFGALTLHLIFLVNIILTAKTFRKLDPRTAMPRTIAMCLGLPMLYALERGNIILLTFTCVLLAFGPLVHSARGRWLAAAIAINLKVYLIGALFAQLLRGRWRWFEGALITTIMVYLVSFSIMGAGTPAEIYRNITDYSSGLKAASLLDLWYAATYKPLLSLLTGESFPVIQFVDSWLVELAPVVIQGATLLVQATIVLAAFFAWWRPRPIPIHRVTFLAIALAVITSEAGGYTQILLILFVFMEPWRGVGRKSAIVIAYILCIPFDIPLSDVPSTAGGGFLALRPVITEYSIGLMPFLRPGLILMLALSMALVTIRDAWSDARLAGWRAPWQYWKRRTSSFPLTPREAEGN